MESLRIALIRARYNPFGGAEKFVANVLSSLQSLDLKLTIITRSWQAQPGVEAIVINPFYLGNVWRDYSFGKGVAKAVHQQHFDLVQSHERLPDCDIYRAGDGVHREWLKQRNRSQFFLKRLSTKLNPYHQYTLRAEKKLFNSNRLKAVICNSHMIKREIQEYFGLPENKFHVIYSGVDGNHFSPELRDKYLQSFREQYGIPQEAIVYLFVGSGFERKGVSAFLQALNQLSPSCFGVVVGTDKRLKKYQSLANDLGISNRLIFTGGLKDPSPAYGAADVFVLPTIYDPFPNAALEAMASGLPIVTSYKSGAAELIENGKNGYTCDALDVKSLVDAMKKLNDKKLRQQLGTAARQTVIPLTFTAMSEKLVALYENLLTK